MALEIIDFYPEAKQDDVPLNTQIFVQFNKPINWNDAYGPYYMTLTEVNIGDTVDGTVAPNTDKTVLYFTPTAYLKPNTKYILYVFGGESGVSAGTGSSIEYLQDQDQSWDFTTGTGIATSPEEASPSGTPSSGIVVTSGNLEVISTLPVDKAINQDVNTQSIAIKFNYVPTLPSGTTWFDFINISRRGVLG